MQSKSQQLFEEAKGLMPGGVNSPVRAFKSVGGSPVFFQSGKGCNLVDVDGNSYIDYVGSWGTALVGHAHPDVIAAVQERIQHGLSFGAPTAYENQLIHKIKKLVPSMEKVRLVNSGTEACMSALRLARAYSKRDKFIKFAGCYHGHHDAFLFEAGSGLATLGIPNCPGVPKSVTEDSISCPYNDSQALKDIFDKIGPEIGTIILEPFMGNSGFVRPHAEFLQTIRELSDRYECVIIFDEVMTGFRVAKGGAQEFLKFKPHLTTLGKVIGGGLPIGAYGGSDEIMSMIAPEGPVYQAGTLSGNPVAVAAGQATLDQVEKVDYQQFNQRSSQICQGLQKIADKVGIPFSTEAQGAMFGFFLSQELPKNFEQVKATDISMFNKLFHAFLEVGVYLPPSAYEACFLCIDHTDEVIDQTLKAAEKAFLKASND